MIGKRPHRRAHTIASGWLLSGLIDRVRDLLTEHGGGFLCLPEAPGNSQR